MLLEAVPHLEKVSTMNKAGQRKIKGRTKWDPTSTTAQDSMRVWARSPRPAAVSAATRTVEQSEAEANTGMATSVVVVLASTMDLRYKDLNTHVPKYPSRSLTVELVDLPEAITTIMRIARLKAVATATDLREDSEVVLVVTAPGLAWVLVVTLVVMRQVEATTLGVTKGTAVSSVVAVARTLQLAAPTS